MAEKWNQFIREHGDEIKSPEMRDEICRYHKEVPRHFNEVIKLEKTEREVKIISDINEALKKYLDFMGLDPLEIPESEIYVLDEENYQSRGVKVGERAYQTHRGIHSRIFIPRMEDENEFVNILTHEMVHAAAYHRTKLDVTVKDDIHIYTNMDQVVREGYGFRMNESSKIGLFKLDFSGLNEAMTEFIASKVRRNYYQSRGEVGEKLDKLGSMGAYQIEYEILYRVLQKYNKLGENDRKLMVDIQRGYFLGDMQFLKKLQIVHPNVTLLFRNMNRSDIDSLIDTSQKFGFTDLTEKLKEIAKTSKK